MSTWRQPRRRRSAGRGPAPVGAWDLAVRRAYDAWRDLAPAGDPSGEAAAGIVVAAAGILPYVVAELRAAMTGPGED